MLCAYLLYLALVLVICPSAGEAIYGWDRRDSEIKKLLPYENGAWRISDTKGLILSGRKVTFGYRYTALFRLKYGGRTRIRMGVFYLNSQEVFTSSGARQRLMAGDRIVLDGVVSFPEPLRNPGGFNAQLYYRTEHIDLIIKPDSVVKTFTAGPVLSFWMCSRDAAADRISLLWKQPFSGVICAMLLGDKSMLDEEIQTQFSEAGIAHIIAISGLHISIVADGIERILKLRMGEKKAGRWALGLIWVYALWTGGALATLRAALMLTIRRGARLFSRTYDPLCAIASSMLVILLLEPLYFLSSAFWLSYMALFGMSFGRILVMRCTILPYWLRKGIASSAGIIFLTGPILLWFYYELSPFSFLLNLWVVPTVAGVIIGAVLALMLSLISPALSGGFVWISQWLIQTYQTGSRFFSDIGFWTLRGQPHVRTMILYYMVLILLGLMISRPKEIQRRIRSLSVIALLFVVALLPHRERRFTFLDVGQGDCAVIEWDQSVVIMDAGPGYEKVLEPYLKMRGIYTIDALMISHPDSDHIKGAIELAESGKFKVSVLIMADQKAHDNELSERLENAVRSQDGEVVRIRAGDSISINEKSTLTFQCLSPGVEYPDSNSGSLVLLAKGENVSVLFMGDISLETEAQMTREGVLKGIETVTVLKAAHHGSNYATGEEFLRQIHPELTVISCGKNNSYGHPGEVMLSRLSAHGDPWRVTAVNGCIQIRLRNDKVQFIEYIRSGESR